MLMSAVLRSKLRHASLYAVVLACFLGPSVNAAPISAIPIEDFFRREKLGSPQLSPSGRYLATVVPVGNRRNLAILDLEQRRAWPITAEKDRDVTGVVWASEDRLLFFMDNDGNESNGIFAVDRDGQRARTLIAPPEVAARNGQAVVLNAAIVSLMDSDTRKVLISASRPTPEGIVVDLETLDIYSGKRQVKRRNPGGIVQWVADENGALVGAVRIKGASSTFLRWDGANEKWIEWSTSSIDKPGWVPAWFSRGLDRWYAASWVNPDGSLRDKAGIFRLDPNTQKLGELVFEHPDVDVSSVISSRKSDQLIGVTINAEKIEQRFLDPAWSKLVAPLAARFPAARVTLTSASRDENRLLFTVWSSTDPGRYFLFDRAKGLFEELGPSRPWLKPETLAPMRPVKIAARDGLVLPGYVTSPRSSGSSERPPMPMVVMPHGGPRARDSYGFDPMVQLLANRGYTVLQVNFRGSVGFGRAFDRAGWREWGGRMQDDITDAVKWAIEQKIADPNKICIFGASYGGYAAMMGLATTPELFRCGINYVGVTDIPLMLETIPLAWEIAREELTLQVGDRKTDLDRLKKTSPVTLAEQIKAPVLMAYGSRDPRVVLDHGRRMETALKAEGVPVELIVKKDEGHGFAKFENQVEWAQRVLDFLARHLAEPSASTARAP